MTRVLRMTQHLFTILLDVGEHDDTAMVLRNNLALVPNSLAAVAR